MAKKLTEKQEAKKWDAWARNGLAEVAMHFKARGEGFPMAKFTKMMLDYRQECIKTNGKYSFYKAERLYRKMYG